MMNILKNITNAMNHLRYVKSKYLRHTYRVKNGINNLSIDEPLIIGIIRQRNEELILEDTLNHMAEFVDGILVFDDSSSDRSVEIAIQHPAVLKVIVRKKWQSKYREWTETVDRNILIKYAKKYNPHWFFYADADERFEGDIRSSLPELEDDIKGVNIMLFDAYMTNEDKKSYTSGESLYGFRKMFGPERRDILMIWRNEPDVWFEGPISRIPSVRGDVITKFYCQHYGKSLSVNQWEETCDYYIKHFPKYSDKWKERKGKAIHTVSDFGRPLFVWSDVKNNSIKIN